MLARPDVLRIVGLAASIVGLVAALWLAADAPAARDAGAAEKLYYRVTVQMAWKSVTEWNEPEPADPARDPWWKLGRYEYSAAVDLRGIALYTDGVLRPIGPWQFAGRITGENGENVGHWSEGHASRPAGWEFTHHTCDGRDVTDTLPELEHFSSKTNRGGPSHEGGYFVQIGRAAGGSLFAVPRGRVMQISFPARPLDWGACKGARARAAKSMPSSPLVAEVASPTNAQLRSGERLTLRCSGFHEQEIPGERYTAEAHLNVSLVEFPAKKLSDTKKWLKSFERKSIPDERFAGKRRACFRG